MAEGKERAAEVAPAQGEMSEDEVDGNLAASFPASDPPSRTLGTDHHEGSRGGGSVPADDDEAG